MGRGPLQGMFAELLRGDFGISEGDLAEFVGEAWQRQCATLGWDEWAYLFDLAGYREDDEPAERPTEVVSPRASRMRPDST